MVIVSDDDKVWWGRMIWWLLRWQVDTMYGFFPRKSYILFIFAIILECFYRRFYKLLLLVVHYNCCSDAFMFYNIKKFSRVDLYSLCRCRWRIKYCRLSKKRTTILFLWLTRPKLVMYLRSNVYDRQLSMTMFCNWLLCCMHVCNSLWTSLYTNSWICY